MSNTFTIEITKEFSLDDLSQGLFLFVFRATRIPPHLGIITSGKLYDISLQGPNTDVSVEDFFETVKKRQSEVVFIELKKPVLSSYLDEDIKHLVNHYWKVSQEVSCLAPIKDFLGQNLNIPKIDEASFLFELLPILEQRGVIKSICQVNLDKKLKNSKLELSKYNKVDVENCINALQRKEQQAC